jgi:small subunit ribosomal protein S4
MKTGPKYKIARRLGAPIFEKTQTQKYALSLARKEKRGKRKPRAKTEFATQLLEKQKARFSYGITEKQFRNYVLKALSSTEPINKLFSHLEMRLDNVLYRAGLAKTRAQARQAASHGHTLVNGRKVTIPSMALRIGDKITIRAGISDSPLYVEAGERMKENAVPTWISVDPAKKEAEVKGLPAYVPSENLFDLGAVIEFYNR